MSFNSFRPFDNSPRSFWKDLALATLPAFVASVMPPVVMHFLDKKAHAEPKPEPKKEEKKPDASVGS